MSVVDRIREYVNKISGAEREILELEAREMNVRFDLKRLATEKIDAEDARRRHLAIVLTGRYSHLDKEDFDALGINGAIAEELKESFGKIEKITNDYDDLRAKYFGYVADRVCEKEKVRGVPVMVYCAGKIVSANKKFKRRFDLGNVNNILKENEDFGKAIRSEKKYEIEIDKGKLVFAFPGKKFDKVGVAYFLPEDVLLENMVGVVKKKGEKAVNKICKELESCLSNKYRPAFS